ncbi:LysR family transcriptional regulator [Marinobacterium jannaschii]|uniref:LysR family transcriptional regulator n=1 Tax=Marinobacterium jannaschii TaxID=64970 RepID=UPI00048370F9|nr:LysR family transcriptional regulator [Marinobacterium jannaschii]
MNVSVKQIRAFVAVASTRSFAEAATLIHLSQPALSIAIKNLEEAVGGPLLVRSTRSLALTPEGEQFLPVAQGLIQDWDGALQDLHSQFTLKRGHLSVAAMPSFAAHQLPVVLSAYRQRYPNIGIRVQDVVAEAVVDMVRSGRVELGIAFEVDAAEDLSFTPLYPEQFVAVLPPEHPLLQYDELRWPMIAAEPFLTLQAPSMVRQLILESVAEQGIELDIEFESHQLVTIIRMVVCGLGLSVVPSLCIPQIEQQGGHWRPIGSPRVGRAVGIWQRQRYPLSSAAEAMIRVLEQEIKGKTPL